MPPLVALSLCIAFIIISFIIDLKRTPHVSRALWIPWIWVMIAGSKSVTLWLDPSAGYNAGLGSYEEGTPIDRAILIILIVASFCILYRRKINWSAIFRNNIWIFLLLLYCSISLIWSDIGFIAFKRWIKAIGVLIIVLVILTEDNPVEAIITLVRRCAYILIPLSILFIKYYPHIGVAYGPWGGPAGFVGVTQTKNALGQLCFICGLIFFWYVAELRGSDIMSNKKKEMTLSIIFLIITIGLLVQSNSMTSLTSLVVAICVFMGLGLPIIRRNLNYIGIFIFLAFSTATILLLVSEIDKYAVESLGRDMTFTGRTILWQDLLDFHTNFFWGVGYDSFWSKERLQILWDKYWWMPNEAHNGYLELYLELGIIGILLLLAVIVNTYRKIRRKLEFEFNYARFKMAYLIAFLLYNVTETAIKSVHIIWFFFLVIALDPPGKSRLAVPDPAPKGLRATQQIYENTDH